MSMVSYYNTAAMYRHQQAMSTPSGSLHTGAAGTLPHPHSWYPTGYQHQGVQIAPPPAAAASYCMQEEQQMWHQHAAAAAFHPEYAHDYSHTAMAAAAGIPHHHQQQFDHIQNQLPSPPITVSGSELSSPGGAAGNITPPNPTAAQVRPPPVRSPYEWIKKPSYQSQPNPGKTRTKDKYRVVYSDHQRVELEKEFYYSRYITIRRKAELAATLGLSERQVKIWFQNRRAKERKQVKKRDECPTLAATSIGASGNPINKSHMLLASNHEHFPFSEVSANGLMIDEQYNHTGEMHFNHNMHNLFVEQASHEQAPQECTNNNESSASCKEAHEEDV